MGIGADIAKYNGVTIGGTLSYTAYAGMLADMLSGFYLGLRRTSQITGKPTMDSSRFVFCKWVVASWTEVNSVVCIKLKA